ncbi:hypothetical protein H0H92_009853, partial [Tricholoma furcatifolium]
ASLGSRADPSNASFQGLVEHSMTLERISSTPILKATTRVSCSSMISALFSFLELLHTGSGHPL